MVSTVSGCKRRQVVLLPRPESDKDGWSCPLKALVLGDCRRKAATLNLEVNVNLQGIQKFVERGKKLHNAKRLNNLCIGSAGLLYCCKLFIRNLERREICLAGKSYEGLLLFAEIGFLKILFDSLDLAFGNSDGTQGTGVVILAIVLFSFVG